MAQFPSPLKWRAPLSKRSWRGRLTIMDVSSKEYWQSDYSTIEEDRFISDFEFTFGRRNDKTDSA